MQLSPAAEFVIINNTPIINANCWLMNVTFPATLQQTQESLARATCSSTMPIPCSPHHRFGTPVLSTPCTPMKINNERPLNFPSKMESRELTTPCSWAFPQPPLHPLQRLLPVQPHSYGTQSDEPQYNASNHHKDDGLLVMGKPVPNHSFSVLLMLVRSVLINACPSGTLHPNGSHKCTRLSQTDTTKSKQNEQKGWNTGGHDLEGLFWWWQHMQIAIARSLPTALLQMQC